MYIAMSATTASAWTFKSLFSHVFPSRTNAWSKQARLQDMLRLCFACRPVECRTHDLLVFVPEFVKATTHVIRQNGWKLGPYCTLHIAEFWQKVAHCGVVSVAVREP